MDMFFIGDARSHIRSCRCGRIHIRINRKNLSLTTQEVSVLRDLLRQRESCQSQNECDFGDDVLRGKFQGVMS